MYWILTYIIGFAICIIVNLLDRSTGETAETLLFLVLMWILSPLMVPMAFVFGLLYCIGLLIKYVTDKIENLLTREDKECKD